MQHLYKQVFDHEIASIPLGISDKAAADWLGIAVSRVTAVRSVKAGPKPASWTHQQPIGAEGLIASKAAAADGSTRLLLAQLRTGILPVPDRGCLTILRQHHGVAA